MADVDSRDSLDDACVVDKSQRFESNGSSKQRDVEQMLARLADAFVRKPSHTVLEDWRLAAEQHVASGPDSPAVTVCVSLAAATIFECTRDVDALDGRNDVDNCSLAFLAIAFGLKLVIVLVIAARA